MAQERVDYFTTRRPNQKLAALARDTVRVLEARVKGDFTARTTHVNELWK
jgi:hypothetical protein